ncbi:MAG: ferrous iron transport protein A [Clostridiales bacterium]|nr:ferrous iron transport protein A [Clostridiales bacterium]
MNHTLCRVPVGATASINSLAATGATRRRLLDIGFTPGARATCLYEAPGGDPRAYALRGAVIALRNEDAARVNTNAGCFHENAASGAITPGKGARHEG